MADISKEELRKEITAILTDADLNTMSAKRVRTLLEEQLEIDLTERKKEVDDLVMKCLQEQQEPPAKAGNGTKKGKDDDPEEEEEEEDEEEDEEEEKPKVKRAAKKPAASSKRAKKANSDSEDASGDEDASDDDYSPAKKAKAMPKKGKGGKKKGAKGSDDDDDEDWNKSKKKAGATGKKAGGGGKKGSGYTKAYTLTPELAAVVGQDAMARHEVVKKVWAIIKERNLYDPKNKQFAICDDELLKVFGVKRFRTFGMMKYLKNHFITE